MSDMSIDQVLAQMRTIAIQAQTPQVNGVEQAAQGGVNFADVLKTSINQVNEVQAEAGNMMKAFEKGDPNVDISEVMIALQKASVSFQAMTQVRNKLVSAYQDIMNMPI